MDGGGRVVHHAAGRQLSRCGRWVSIAFRMQKSVLPSSALIALPSAVITGFLRWVVGDQQQVEQQGGNTTAMTATITTIATIANTTTTDDLWALPEMVKAWEIKAEGFSILTAMVTYLVVFRTSQSFNRFWSGCEALNQINGSFYDAFSSIIAFTKTSKADAAAIKDFREAVVCLFSLLTALCYHDVLTVHLTPGSIESEQVMNRFQVLEKRRLSSQHYQDLLLAPCRPSIAIHWIESLMVENIPEILNTPPPILVRAFQELSDGFVNYEDCSTVAFVPFPRLYSQVTFWLLALNLLMTPLAAGTFAEHPVLAALLSFVTVFVHWTLFLVSFELDNPFGDDESDMHLEEMHQHLNDRFTMLMQPAALAGSRLKPLSGNGG